MTYADIKAELEARPFQPFRIHMDNGKAFDVRHPELVKNTLTAVYIYRGSSEDQTVPESALAVCGMAIISTIEPLTESAA